MSTLSSVPVGDVANVFNGKTPAKSEQRDSGHPVLKIKDVTDSGEFLGWFDSFVDESLAAAFDEKKLRINDTLVLNAAHNSDYVGSKQYRVQEAVVGSLPTGEWLVLRAKEEKLDPVFASYWMSSNETKFRIKQLVKGIHLYPKDVKRLEIPLLPLPEQKRIAAILDKADAIRRKRQQATKLADQFLRSIFLDLFGDPVTNPRGWKVLPIKKLGKVTTGSTPSSSLEGMFGDEMPFVTPGDLDGNLVSVKRWLTMEGANQSRVCRPGSLMACCIGATIGKVGMATQTSAFNQQINAVEWDTKINDVFGYYLFKLFPVFITKNAIKTTLPILKKSLFEAVEIPVPDTGLQESFASIFARVSSIVNVHRNFLNEPLFEAISQRAFSGEM